MQVKYIENGDVALYNGYRFRRDKRTGYYLSSKKLGGRQKRLHVYIWETEVGKIPKGYSVHHIDKDKSHNDISNFALMTRSKHEALHANERVQSNYNDIVKNLRENATPASKEWHKSAEGHEWHKHQYEKTKDKLHAKAKLICKQCGKEFYGDVYRNKFCSNACKSAYRRASGVDNVERTCECCGGKFVTNKYSKAKYCPICKNKAHRKSRA